VGRPVRSGATIRAEDRRTRVVGTESACGTAVAGRDEVVVGAAGVLGDSSPGPSDASAGIGRAACARRSARRAGSARAALRIGRFVRCRQAGAARQRPEAGRGPVARATSATTCGVRCGAPSVACVDSPRSHPRACSGPLLPGSRRYDWMRT
jgi:hypothetical protein